MRRLAQELAREADHIGNALLAPTLGNAVWDTGSARPALDRYRWPLAFRNALSLFLELSHVALKASRPDALQLTL